MQRNEIKTRRLILREITEKDAELIVSWRSDPNVYKYFRSPHELTYEEHMKWYDDRYLCDERQIIFIAVENITQKSIGVFGIRQCSDREDCVEVSYLLDIDAQGNGFAQEVVSELLDFALKKWNITKSIAEIHKDNKASITMIQKLGFHLLEQKDNFLIYERSLCYT